MRILIFGATGKTGRYLVTQALATGFIVTAFVRNAAALQIQNKNLSLVQGNIQDIKQVEDAIKNHDVVISALGNKTSRAFWERNTVISEGVKYIIAGMQKYKVKRLLFITSFGVNKNIFLPEKYFIRIILKNIFADIPKQEQLIKESNVDWTIVHPARLTNDQKTEIYKSGEELSINPFSKISRADVADFLLKQITNKTYVHKIVTIRY